MEISSNCNKNIITNYANHHTLCVSIITNENSVSDYYCS